MRRRTSRYTPVPVTPTTMVTPDPVVAGLRHAEQTWTEVRSNLETVKRRLRVAAIGLAIAFVGQILLLASILIRL